VEGEYNTYEKVRIKPIKNCKHFVCLTKVCKIHSSPDGPVCVTLHYSQQNDNLKTIRRNIYIS
jgi:hypothetical protein